MSGTLYFSIYVYPSSHGTFVKEIIFIFPPELRCFIVLTFTNENVSLLNRYVL